MRTATLVRNVGDDDSQGTFGTMTLDDGSNWHSLELPWRDNDHGTSCIPTGTYLCQTINSPKHGNPTYQVKAVPGRGMIEIHSANFAGEVSGGWESQLLGCIALGKTVGEMDNTSGNQQLAVLSSKVAIAEFYANLNSEDFTLTISNKNGDN